MEDAIAELGLRVDALAFDRFAAQLRADARTAAMGVEVIVDRGRWSWCRVWTRE